MLDRFRGTVEPICPVDIAAMATWIAAIDFADWPQQPRREDGRMRPAMACDPEWYGFRAIADPVVDMLMTNFPGCAADTRMLSVVMPGHLIAPHIDQQSESWRCRIHVPLVTNQRSRFIVCGVAHLLKPGTAYRVNTEVEHSVENDGDTGRIHFMFDVRRV